MQMEGKGGIGEGCVCACVLSRVQLFATCSLLVFSILWNFPGNDTGTGCHFLLQRIFPTQGWNPRLLHLLHRQADCLPLRHPESLSRGRWLVNKRCVCETERSASPSKGSNGGTVGLTWAQVSPGGATIEQRLGYCPGYGEADGAGNIGERRRKRPAGGAGAAGGNGWAN